MELLRGEPGQSHGDFNMNVKMLVEIAIAVEVSCSLCVTYHGLHRTGCYAFAP